MELRAFWSACEALVGPAAVGAEWKRLAGDDYDAARVFLRPVQEAAARYPCPRHPPCSCYHRVVNHGDGRIAAVCDCRPRRCDTVLLNESDIIVDELDRPALHSAIGNALSLQPAPAEVPGLPWVTRIGFDSPCAGYRFGVYFVLTPRPDRFTGAALALAATDASPFILIAPTAGRCEPACLDLLNSRKSLFLTLPDVMSVDGEKPVAAERCGELLREFHLAIIPALQPDSKEASPIAFFPTPPDAAWGDVQILFRDGHTVSVSAGDQAGVYNYVQMGMSKRNSGTPTAQWRLLEAFAKGRGAFDWNSEQASRNQKKRKQLLSEALRRFFRLDGDPFRYVEETKGWEARFEVGYAR